MVTYGKGYVLLFHYFMATASSGNNASKYELKFEFNLIIQNVDRFSFIF